MSVTLYSCLNDLTELKSYDSKCRSNVSTPRSSVFVSGHDLMTMRASSHFSVLNKPYMWDTKGGLLDEI